jgi:hypothetical protein
MPARLRFAAIALLALVAAAPLRAQDTSFVEIGLDAQIKRDETGNGTLTIAAPLGRVRVGWYITRAWSLEPTFAFNHVDPGSTSATQFAIGLGALYHFRTERSSPQPYVRPYVVSVNSRTKTPTANLSSGGAIVGVGLGVKIPMVRNLSWRLEGAFEKQGGNSHYLINAGISFFTW